MLSGLMLSETCLGSWWLSSLSFHRDCPGSLSQGADRWEDGRVAAAAAAAAPAAMTGFSPPDVSGIADVVAVADDAHP